MPEDQSGEIVLPSEGVVDLSTASDSALDIVEGEAEKELRRNTTYQTAILLTSLIVATFLFLKDQYLVGCGVLLFGLIAADKLSDATVRLLAALYFALKKAELEHGAKGRGKKKKEDDE